LSLFQALVLGIVQGLTEFLPISSSGHLILVPWLFGWPEGGLSFDAALHLGTAIALLAYFWREWLALVQAVVEGLREPAARKDPRWRLACYILIGSIPAGLVGVVLESKIEELLGAPRMIALLLIVFGLLLLIADRLAAHRRTIDDVGLPDALTIGLAQVLALAPGVSRSGITITTGLLRGLDRAAAARFSFLLSTPITLGASLYSMRKLVGPGANDNVGPAALAVGVASAAVFGFLAIGFLLRYLQRNSLSAFVWYRLAAGLLLLVITSLGLRG
jgi:undecaprenyl-diphosphatase